MKKKNKEENKETQRGGGVDNEGKDEEIEGDREEKKRTIEGEIRRGRRRRKRRRETEIKWEWEKENKDEDKEKK